MHLQTIASNTQTSQGNAHDQSTISLEVFRNHPVGSLPVTTSGLNRNLYQAVNSLTVDYMSNYYDSFELHYAPNPAPVFNISYKPIVN